jgi:hypothetical protein
MIGKRRTRRMAGSMLGAIAMIALASCSDERIADEEVLARAGTLEDPAPGLYAVTTELDRFEVTGAPPAVADRLRVQSGGVQKSTSQRCVTEKDADKGFEPLLREFAEMQNGLDCGFTRFEADAPRFNAKLTCTGPLDATAAVAFAGETSRQGFDMTMDTEASSRIIAGGTMAMRLRFSSERVGECSEAADARVEPPPAL